ncbi:hypothetical protein L6164_034976 [Bauhinia variegata]|uniref:Uncharacterized protein n=1 Tax=Bauhinia variegata TaxID=167791 RepID=A0ACB9KWI9_BAUVA|nr:hypothetical protein L6164_034976 [Bauhinia variegata]
MRTGSMSFSLVLVPRYRIHSLANHWDESLHNLNRNYGNNSGIRLLDSRIYGLQGGHGKKWTRRPVTTKREGSNKTSRSPKSRSIEHETLSETILTSATENVNKTELGQLQEIQYSDIQKELAQNKDLTSLLTIIVFDTETTGFMRKGDRIIEIALRDLQGGENSTFQTLVNPQRYILNSHVHGITTQMVNKPDVPRMEDLIPILMKYVRSREKSGGYVLWVAHNARTFDVPFLINEFSRCSTEIPPNWLFVDTLPLAREVIKFRGTELSSTSLPALAELYKVKVDGSAHRAMVDVNKLAMILPKLTFDLKLTISDLFERSFKPDLINFRRKKNTD